MKIFVSLLIGMILISGSAEAAQLILSLRYENQIYGSKLDVFDDGQIQHQEKSCCSGGVTWTQVPSVNLNQDQLAALESEIGEAANGSVLKLPSRSAFGSQSGELDAFIGGRKVIINDQTWVRSSGGMQMVNQSAAARSIESFVASIAKSHP